jgi:adenine-specific DNA-methyltransferase
MARGPAKTPSGKKVDALKHEGAARKNIPTAEYQSVAERLEEANPVDPVHYPRRTPLTEGETRTRDPDLDPQIIWKSARIRLSPEQVRQLQEKGELEIGDAQLVWRGKDSQDWSDLIVIAPPLYIQEKVHPKAIIDDLVRRTKAAAIEKDDAPDLFADFNGLTDPEARTEFYQHDQNWSNRMILGDSLQVMASLAEREGLRGKVQCIYFDPPYGIKFNSNWQVSTQSRDVKDGKQTDILREPEQVKAFRDTWKDGIHSYLTYLRDRLTAARDLLHESGSIFVQIGDENVHRVRAMMDEVFGVENEVAQIVFRVTANLVSNTLGRDSDYILWYARHRRRIKYRQLYKIRTFEDDIGGRYSRVQFPGGNRVVVADTGKSLAELKAGGALIYRHDNLTSQGATPSGTVEFQFQGHTFDPGRSRHWTTAPEGLDRLGKGNRLGYPTPNSLAYVRFFEDFPVSELTAVWRDTQTGAFTDQKTYVVQTNTKIIERCILMATDPGDLVLDPTCGSGTTGFVAEQWGRRWIAIDT